MPRECNCAGGCGPADGSGRAGPTLISMSETENWREGGRRGWTEWAEQQGDAAELAAWKKSLHERGKSRVYASDRHTDARFPLGGIGAGNIDLCADGQLTTWQLFNTLRDGYVPLFFVVKVGDAARLLQTRGGPEVSRVPRIEMTGDYPLATLRYLDDALPVRIEMTAFSPFAPLDSRLSSMPAALFTFKVHNPGSAAQRVSLAALMQNPVGYDAMGAPISFNSVGFNEVGARLEPIHPNFGGNRNRAIQEAGATGILMSARPAPAPSISSPLAVFTNLAIGALNAAPPDRPKSLGVEPLDRLGADPPTRDSVIWLEQPAADLSDLTLRSARTSVQAGGTLIISGSRMPLLEEYARITGGKPFDRARLRPDIVFEDFENGYGKWKVEGEAFGEKPAAGTLPNQQRVTGFQGKGLVNSYLGGDERTGKLTSAPFNIERNYIRFLVGGGGYEETAIRLLVDGRMVRKTSGRNNERLEPAWWDVRDFAGKRAVIEIVDEAKGGWGHVNVDQIEFCDLPSGVEALAILDELLPARFSGIARNEAREREGGWPVILDGLTPKEGSSSRATAEGFTVLEHRFGQGKVILHLGRILDPRQAEFTGARQSAYVSVCGLAGAEYVRGSGVRPDQQGFGEVALVCASPGVQSSGSCGDFGDAIREFAASGRLPGPAESPSTGSPLGHTVNGGVSATVEVAPGRTVEIPFILAWRYPNKYNQAGIPIGNHYAAVWPDARAVVREAAGSLGELRQRAEKFRTVFYDSTLPWWLLDCITSQVSTIRHAGVVFRTENGDAYGWEGSNGCCQPTCTHVWGYEQTLARLFPDLERDMRRIDFKHQQRPDGGINNRTEFPSPPRPTGEQPFTDGHASCVLKAYREAMNHPDESWLRDYWPGIKRAVQYLIDRDSKAQNPPAPRGLLADEQWNTYDDAIHGVNSFIGSYYLAALRAGEEMALRMGDNAFAGRCRQIFEDGKRNLTDQTWNGEYFFQNLPDAEQRWGEYGKGCLSDQLIGQWWAHQLGLGYLLPKDRVQTALRTLYGNNWLADMSNWRHNQRPFAGGKDKGLLICTWPKGGRPANPLPYVDEVWTGVEYQVAAHMIYEGMVDEAFAIIKGVRDRYDGAPRPPMPRNPWNEIECGGHYARAMSSWSILLALSGYEVDGPRQALRFTPRCTPAKFRAPFVGPEGWGTLDQRRSGRSQQNRITLAEGRLSLKELHLDPPGNPAKVRVSVGRAAVPAEIKPRMDGVAVRLLQPIQLKAGDTLLVTLS